MLQPGPLRRLAEGSFLNNGGITVKSPGKIATAYLSIVVFIAAQTVPVYGIQPASPELVSALTKGLSITPHQATGGAGALFSLAKSRLNPADFGKIAGAVPGMGSFLKAAPSTSTSGGSGLSGLTGSLPGGMGGLTSAATSFQKLGLSPSMVQKFLPIMTNFLQAKGGSNVASLFSGALK
jgi:Protein of unknown function VcgC/VcgE (DUF2780)